MKRRSLEDRALKRHKCRAPSPTLSTALTNSRTSHRPLLRIETCCDEVIPVPNDERPDSLKEEPAPYSPPPETQRLIDELYREEVVEARAMQPEDKFLA